MMNQRARTLQVWVATLIPLASAWMLPRITQAQDVDSSNAATWYQRAYHRLDDITSDQWRMLIEYEKAGGTPSAEVRALLQSAQPAIADLRRAANQPYTDFGLENGRNEGMLIEHLNGVRNLSRLAAADARMRLADGDGTGAVVDITSLYRMVGHTADDHVMISSRFSSAVFDRADGLIEAGFDAAAFSAGETSLLLDAVKSFDERDPFQSFNAMVGEQFSRVQSMSEALAGGDQAAVDRFVDTLGGDDAAKAQFQRMGAEGLQAELDTYGKVMDQYAAAFAMKNPAAASSEIARLDKACADGEFGVLLSFMRPDFIDLYDPLAKSREMLKRRVDSLEKILGGETSIDDLANAAVWYRHGIEEMDGLDEAWKRSVADVDPGRPLTLEKAAELEAGYNRAEEVIKEFIEGSKIRRCDFSKGRDPREAFVPFYAPGMRDAFRLLALESLRSETKGDHARVVQLLSAAFRMDAHLSGDHLLVSSLVARWGILFAAQVGQGMNERAALVDAGLPELKAAIRQSGAADPFGFIAALSDQRQTVRNGLLNLVSDADREARTAALDTWLEDVDADGIIYLLAMENQLGAGYLPQEPFNRGGAERLTDFLLDATIDLAAIDAPAFAELIKQGKPSSFQMPETVHIVSASKHMATARQDLWDALAWERAREAALRDQKEPQP